MFGATRVIPAVLLGFMAATVGAFTVLFVTLIYDAFSLANTRGMPYMFTSYGYISIEIIFLGMILYAAYQVFNVGMSGKTDDDLALD